MYKCIEYSQPDSLDGAQNLAVQHKTIVGGVELLEKDEQQNGVWSQTEVVRCEAFPQREHTFVANYLNVGCFRKIHKR